MPASFATLKIGARLSLGFGLVLLLLAVAVGLSIQRLAAFNEAFSELASHRVPNMTLAEDWQQYLQDSGLKMRNILILDSRADIEHQVEAVREDQAKRREIVEALEKAVVLSEGKAILQEALEAREVYAPLEQRFLDLVAADDLPAAKKLLLEHARPAQIKNIDAIGKLVEFEKAAVKQGGEMAAATYRAGKHWLLMLGTLALLAGALAAVVITRSVLTQLGGEPTDAAAIAGKIAEGKLDIAIELKSGDDRSVLFAMESMRAKLTEIVGQVRHGAAHMAQSTQQISQGNDDLNHRTQEQAAAIEETASSMEQMTATVLQNAQNARHASDLAATTREQAERGGAVVRNAISAMAAINASSRQIVDIISVIDEIAFQTNLLALNAAVESARAGEQGRGFAVVANEVRTLAQRSASAAKEIKVLIQDSVEKVKAGTDLVDTSGATLNEIIVGIKKVTDIVGEIVVASREQSSGIEQINNAITQMDTVTQQNAALVEQATAASKTIEDEAAALSRQIAFFKTGGRSSAPAPAALGLLSGGRSSAPAPGRSMTPVTAALGLLPIAALGPLSGGRSSAPAHRGTWTPVRRRDRRDTPIGSATPTDELTASRRRQPDAALSSRERR